VQSPSPSAANPSRSDGQEKSAEFNIVTPKPSFPAEQPITSSDPKSVFVKEFFANKPQQPAPDSGDAKVNDSWRQITLQRRAAVESVTKPIAVPLPATRSAAPSALPSAQGAFTIPSSQAVGNILYGFPTSPVWLGRAQLVSTKPAAVQSSRKDAQDTVKPVLLSKSATREEKKETPSTTTSRSTTAVLDQLPKDDVDFLTAGDLRAAIAGKRAALKGMGSKELERKSLEKAFADTKQGELDPVIESSIVNDQYVRRTQRAMQDTQEARPGSLDTTNHKQSISDSSTTSPPLESSVDRMRRWLEEGGSSLSKHFWQDPIDESGPSQHDLHFLKQAGGFEKGRRAVVHIIDDLKKDLPASRGLLESLDRDQSRVEQAIQILRHPKPTNYRVEVSQSLRLIKERRLRKQFEATEKQLDAARKALRELEGTSAVSSVSGMFKNRLDIASKIFHKNSTLTRTLMWSAQARLEDPDVNRAKIELYSEVLSRMTTLRDTQLALASLMDYAMQVYGVVPKPAQESVPRKPTQDTPASPPSQQTLDPSPQEKPTTLGAIQSPNTNARLDNEIQALKSAMQGLSDDGYARAPSKQSAKLQLDTPNPLAHSLFRPFNLQLENLTKEAEVDITADKLREEMRKKERDRSLVEDIRSAYEDTYGRITVDHKQLPDDTERREELGETSSRAFEMLKEDPVAASNGSTQVGLNEASLAEETSVSTEAAAAGVHAQTTAALEPEATEVASEFASAASSNNDNTPAALPPPPAQTSYTILLHDPHAHTLTTTHTTTPSPDPSTPSIPLHTALAILTHPSKFLPHIPASTEIIAAKPDLLVLRSLPAHAPAAFETITTTTTTTTATVDADKADTAAAAAAGDAVTKPAVNPIDGTARLSPTGYIGVGVPETQDEADREFADRRAAAVRMGGREEGVEASVEKARVGAVSGEKGFGKRGRRGGAGAGGGSGSGSGLGKVVRTAIWAGAACYVVGVLGEVVR
jgi:hypothetical protein